MAALDPKHSAGERLLRAAISHFDRIMTQREFQNLMQQEMVRFRRGERGEVPLLVKKVFKPLLMKIEEAVREGIRSRELCEFDWLQVVYSMFGQNVFFFLSAPMVQLALPLNPFEPAALEARRLHDSIMSVGNTIDAGEAFRRFRGRDVTIDALMRDRGFPAPAKA